MRELDAETRELVTLAVTIAVGNEAVMRDAIETAAEEVRPEWAEEAILQSYLFVGFPRALNAMRAWRKTSRRAAPAKDTDPAADPGAWRTRGATAGSSRAAAGAPREGHRGIAGAG